MGNCRIRLLLFASLRDNLSEDSVVDLLLHQDHWTTSQELKIHLLEELRRRWIAKHGSNDNIELPLPRTIMLAIDDEYIQDNVTDIVLRDNQELALIPPVSGG